VVVVLLLLGPPGTGALVVRLVPVVRTHVDLLLGSGINWMG
jgi:hypothetical protein